MPRPKQPHRHCIVHFPQTIEAHGVRPLQSQALAVVEGERDVDGFDEFQIRKSVDETLCLLESGMNLAENADRQLRRFQGFRRRLGAPHGALLHAVLTIRDLPADQRAVWAARFQQLVFADQERVLEHLPPSLRSMLAPPSAERTRKIREILARDLNAQIRETPLRQNTKEGNRMRTAALAFALTWIVDMTRSVPLPE